jgi:hypothetical protein
MSLVRWGEEASDVYVYNCEDDQIECCCDQSFRCKKDSEMAIHLKNHQKIGHHVPQFVFEVLSGKMNKFLYKNQK